MYQSIRVWHPLVELREAAGLSRIGLSRRTGIPYHRIANYELGYDGRTPRKFESVFRAFGVDPDAAERQYQTWRKELTGAASHDH